LRQSRADKQGKESKKEADADADMGRDICMQNVTSDPCGRHCMYVYNLHTCDAPDRRKQMEKESGSSANPFADDGTIAFAPEQHDS
jgi:hypothetical protein